MGYGLASNGLFDFVIMRAVTVIIMLILLHWKYFDNDNLVNDDIAELPPLMIII